MKHLGTSLVQEKRVNNQKAVGKANIHTEEYLAERLLTRSSPLLGHAAGGFPASVAFGS